MKNRGIVYSGLGVAIASFLLASCGGGKGGDSVKLKTRFNAGSFSCHVIPSVAKQSLYVDSQGNFYPNFGPQPVEFRVVATRGTSQVQVNIVSSSFDSQKFERVSSNSQELRLLPKQAGTSRVSYVVADAQDLSASVECSENFTLETGPAPALQLMIAAITPSGFLAPLANGQSATIRWSSSGTTKCELYKDNLLINADAAISGEVSTGALLNLGSSPVVFQYAAKCFGNGQSATQSVAVAVNPGPGVDLKVAVGSSNPPVDGPVDILKNGSTTLYWSSVYATNGCVLSDGMSAPSPALPSGSLPLSNIQATLNFRLTCSDLAGTTSYDVVSIRVKSPSLYINVNGTRAIAGQSLVYTKPVGQNLTIEWGSQDVGGCILSPLNLQVNSGMQTIPSSAPNVYGLFSFSCQTVAGPLLASVEVKSPCTPANDEILGGDPFALTAINGALTANGFIQVRDVLHDNDATALKLCQILGYDRVVSHGCTAPGYNNRCGFSSPSNNVMTRYNGAVFEAVPASSVGNRWMASLRCERTCR